MKERLRGWSAALTGLGLGLLAVGPGLAPGFVLSYDMVFVPDPEFGRMAFGLTGTVPRHVPSDAFVTALTTVLPGAIVQKALLIAIFVMACASAAALLPGQRTAARLAAGVCYAWNPFVAERLLLGHWALLLGYAALPWVVGAAARAGDPGGARRLARALIPAAIGGFAALAVSALAALCVVSLAAPRRLARTLAVLVTLSLPWLVTGWLRPGGMPGDGAAVAAFAPRADTPFGVLGSLLLLGGVWNRETVPAGYGAAVTATAWLLLVLVALAAYAWLCRTSWASGLAAAAALGYACAALAVVAPGLLRRAIELWPGFAVLRDGQQYVAPLAVLVAVGLGLAVDRLLEIERAAPPARPSARPLARLRGALGRPSGSLAVPAALGALAALAPIALLPSLAWGAADRLRPVDYPAEWAQARRIIAADRTRGDVLVLPWATYRAYPWNGGRTSLDPLPRYLHRRVILSDAVTIGGPGRRAVTIPAEDPRARRLDPIIRGTGELTPALRAVGIRYVILDAETARTNPLRARLAAAQHLLDRPDIVLYRIPAPAAPDEPTAPVVPAVLSWLALAAAVGWAAAPISRIRRAWPAGKRSGTGQRP